LKIATRCGPGHLIALHFPSHASSTIISEKSTKSLMIRILVNKNNRKNNMLLTISGEVGRIIRFLY
jgi:hypothetical protein